MLTSATGRDVGELPGAQGVKDLVVTAVALAAMMAHAAQVRSLVQEFPPAVVPAKKKKRCLECTSFAAGRLHLSASVSVRGGALCERNWERVQGSKEAALSQGRLAQPCLFPGQERHREVRPQDRLLDRGVRR